MHYDWRRHPYTNLCRHSGLTIPECSCPACIEGQIARANVERQRSQEAASAGALRIEHEHRSPVLA